MTCPQYPRRKTPAPSESFWLTPHRSEFVETLDGQGYHREVVYQYRRMTGYLCEEAEAREFGPDALNLEVMEDLARACPGSVSTKKAMTQAMRGSQDTWSMPT